MSAGKYININIFIMLLLLFFNIHSSPLFLPSSSKQQHLSSGNTIGKFTLQDISLFLLSTVEGNNGV